MRWTATALVVALLGAPVLEAKAAEAPTTPVSGVCEWSPEPALAELTDVVECARCEAAAAVDTDDHLITTVVSTPLFDGPRPFGHPSGIRLDLVAGYNPTPHVDAASPLFAHRWTTYAGFKERVEFYNGVVDYVAEDFGEFQATHVYVIGPKWLRYTQASFGASSVHLAGGLLATPANLILLPEQIYRSPESLGHGLSEMKDGWDNRNYDRLGNGLAEVCGTVGMLASVAIPIAKGGAAFFKPGAPRTPFGGRMVPRLSGKSSAPAQGTLVRALPRASAPTPKFADYIFREGATHGKDAVFRKLGYAKEHSGQLASIWERQAAKKYARGDYKLGKLDGYGQRIEIEIELHGIGDAASKTSYMKSGWIIEGDGSIRLATPFAGFTR